MFERRVQTANHFRSGFEERLRFRFIIYLMSPRRCSISSRNSFRTFAVCARGSFDAIVSIQCVRLWNRAQTHQIRESSYFFLLPSYLYSVPIIVFALLLFVLLAFAGVVLLSLALRYRAGTARRQARRWVASLNVWMTSFSAVFFLSFTLLLSFWVDSAFRFALIGMGCGGILGLIGLAMTRWESQPEGLFYTPSRWLALFITLAIAARFVYGWWRATHSGSNAPGDQHWLITASGTQLSLAVAAGLIGYYLVYSVGVRLRVARHEQRRSSAQPSEDASAWGASPELCVVP
jgi:hypothetical protein